jgi:hypothetical protein
MDSTDSRRLPDVLVLLAEIDDDEEFRLWNEQLLELRALPMTAWWRRALRGRHRLGRTRIEKGPRWNPQDRQ